MKTRNTLPLKASMFSERDRQKFLSKTRAVPSGCVEWAGGVDARGYGHFYLDGRTLFAHRVALILAGRGPIDGYVIDHLCRNRRCVRPDHLEAVSDRVNILRGSGPSAAHSVKTHCSQGHPFDEQNTYMRVRNGRLVRGCRACNHAAVARYRARRDAS